MHRADKHPRWEFLRAVQKSGSPLARQTLVTRCVNDRSILTFVFDTVRAALPS